MKAWLKRIGIGLGSLIGLLLLTLAVANAISYSRQQNTYAVTVGPFAMPSDSAAIARGRHLATAVGACTGCHGPDLGGDLLMDNPVVGRLAASNLTSGRGGIGANYKVDDWVRAIRHGVGRDGKSLIFMPSGDYQVYSDADLGALIAFLRTVPPVDRTHPKPRVGPMARVMHLTGFPLLPAEIVDHGGRRSAPLPSVNAAYGDYIAGGAGCRGCHGPALAGGAGPGPNITLGAIGSWRRDDFVRLIRQGTRPDGSRISDEMPWKQYKEMSDLELHALWEYVRSLPPVAKKT